MLFKASSLTKISLAKEKSHKRELKDTTVLWIDIYSIYLAKEKSHKRELKVLTWLMMFSTNLQLAKEKSHKRELKVKGNFNPSMTSKYPCKRKIPKEGIERGNHRS